MHQQQQCSVSGNLNLYKLSPEPERNKIMNGAEEERQFNQVFGEHTGLSDWRERIEGIKDNNDSELDLHLYDDFTDIAWKLLGLYIVNNTHLRTFSMRDRCNLNNQIKGCHYYLVH